MRIDAHQHYWKISRGDYGWITPEQPVLHRDYMPVDMKDSLSRHGLSGTILVQAAATTQESEFLLELAQKEDSILGVVGWLDLEAADHMETFSRFAAYPKFVGFRLMIQDMPDSDAILEPSIVEALRTYAVKGIPIDLLLRSHQLESLLSLMKLVPDLRGVIDHIGKPEISEGESEPWRSCMSALAAYPNLFCKLSGMVTEADHGSWRKDQFAPYVRHVTEVFGLDRVMFGSDWPVCLLAAAYDEVVAVLESSLPPEWGSAERDRLYGLNAKEFYRL